jgi:hypothetical protein
MAVEKEGYVQVGIQVTLPLYLFAYLIALWRWTLANMVRSRSRIGRKSDRQD